MRIVSLLPSATEILCALGPRLVERLEILAHLLHPEEFSRAPGRAGSETFASFTP